MEYLKIEIKTTNDTDIELIYHPSSMSSTIINCSLNQLKRHYKIINTHDLSPKLLKQIIKENRFPSRTVNNFAEQIELRHNKKKEYTFQIEQKTVLITQNATGEELWTTSDKIKNYWLFTTGTWNKLKGKKDRKIVVISRNFQTNDNNAGF